MVHRRIFKSVLNSVLVAAQNKITFSSKKYNSPKEDMILLYLNSGLLQSYISSYLFWALKLWRVTGRRG